MKTSKITSRVLGILLLPCLSYSQASSSSISNKEQKEDYNWNLSLTGGITHYYDDRLFNATSLSYLEYGVGYFISLNHEIGLKIGRNDFVGGSIGVITLRYGTADTTVTYGIINGLYLRNWFALYYKFNYHSWYAGITFGALGKIDIEADGYNSISVGREFRLSNMFYLNAGLNYAFISNNILKYKFVNSKQLSLTAGLSIKL